MSKIKPGKYGEAATREQLEAELKRRGWTLLVKDAEHFANNRWQKVKTKGLWFRPKKLQAEIAGPVRGVLFVNALIEEGLDAEFPTLHSQYLALLIDGGWKNGIKRLPTGNFLVDTAKRHLYLKSKAKK